MDAISVLIIDDHPLVRLGVVRSLEGMPHISVVGACANSAATRDWLVRGGRADVAILDRGLPDGDGLDLVPALKTAGMKVIVLTAEDSGCAVRDAIGAGVDGYLLKSSSTAQIGHAIDAVSRDAGAFPPQVMRKLYQDAGRENPLARLSSREREIAECVADGLSNKGIGCKLNLSDHTVRNHLANIMQKFDLHNRVQVASLVLRNQRIF